MCPEDAVQIHPMAKSDILYKFGMDRYCLKQLGLSEKTTNDFYKSMYMLVTGFHTMVNMLVSKIKLQENVESFLSRVWELYLYLIEKGNKKFYEDIETCVEKNRVFYL